MSDSESPETTGDNSEPTDKSGAAPHPDANAVIAAFGGIRPMAAQMGLAVSTVQGWKMRNAIPENRWAEVEAAAQALGIDLTALPPAQQPAEPEPQAAEGEKTEAPGEDASSGESAEEAAEPEQAQTRDLSHPEKPTGMDLPPLEERRRGGALVAWSALLIGLIALVAIVARPIWAPFVQPFVEPIVEAYLPKIEQTEPPASQGEAAGEAEIAELASRVVGMETKIDNLVRLQEDITRLDTRIKGLADSPGASGATGEDLTALKDLVADLDARMANAEDRLGDAISAEAFANRMTELEQSLKTLSENTEAVRELASTAGSALNAIESDVTAVNERLTDIANRPVQSGARAAAVVLAVGQLEASVMAGVPYQGALDHLARLVGDDAGFAEPMAALGARAGSGLPTRTELSRRFARLAPDATRTAKVEAADGWLDKTMARVSGLVTIRRVDGDPSGPAAPVTKAEQALGNDDLAAAVAALKGLNGPIAAWVDDAGARLAAEAALATLRGLAIDRLSAAEAALAAEPTQ